MKMRLYSSAHPPATVHTRSAFNGVTRASSRRPMRGRHPALASFIEHTSSRASRSQALLPSPGMAERPLLSGSILLNQIKVCEERFGQPLVQEALRELSASEMEQLRGLLPVSWIRTEVAERVLDVVAKRSGRDADTLYREVVVTTVERQFRTVWRAILHFTTDNALVSRTPVIYSKTYNSGTLTSEIYAPGRSRLIVTGWPNNYGRQMHGLGLGIGTVLRLAGRKHVDVTHSLRQGGAEFQATWKP